MWLITREQVRLCHDYVPVLFWPVLWLSLIHLNRVLWKAGLEGRERVFFYVSRCGLIRIGLMSESPAERAARGALPPDFDYTPWTRAVPLGGSALWAVLGGGLVARTPATPSRHHDDTAMTPLAHRHATPLRPP